MTLLASTSRPSREPTSRGRVAGGIAVAALLACGPVAHAAAPWRAPSVITADSAGVHSPTLAVNDAGSAAAAWVRQAGGGEIIEAATRSFAGDWSAPVNLTGPANGGVGSPSVAVDAAGTAMVAWRPNNGAFVQVAVRPAATGAWRELETVPGPGPFGPQIGIDGGGNATVASYAFVPFEGFRLVAGERPARTGAWSPPRLLTPEPAHGPGALLAVSRSGAAVAQIGVGGGAARIVSRPAGGDWEPPQTLLDGGLPAGVGIAIDEAGNGLVLQTANSDELVAVQTADRPAGGAVSAFARIAQPRPAGTPSAGAVQFDSAGNAVASWLAQGGGQSVVRVGERPAGGAFGLAQTISPVERKAIAPQLALAGTTAVILWLRAQGRETAVRAAIRPGPGRPWGEPEAVTALGGVRAAVVGVDARGRAAAVWIDSARGILAADRMTGRPTPVRLTAEQLLINQRIAQAALRRARVLTRRTRDLTGADIRAGALTADRFVAVDLDGSASGVLVPPGPRRPVVIPRPDRRPGASVAVSAAQLRITQRIAQRAVVEANRLTARLDGRLTGCDIRDGAIGAANIAAGLRVRAWSPSPQACSAPGLGRPRGGGAIALSTGQLLINQRIAQAALLRLNSAREQIETGLPGSAFRPGTITAVKLAANVAPSD